MKKYIESTDPEAFVDWPQLVLDQLRDMSHRHGYTKLCPRCSGHGGWNLALNQYPLHNKPDTAHNRHLFVHFRCACPHCSGWGWIHPDDTCPNHEFEKVKSIARCLHLYRCKNCGAERTVDSSD